MFTSRQTHKRHQVYESESLFRTTVPACAVNAVDELQEYGELY